MTRPLRIEFDGALYHVTTRGDRCEFIYHDDIDRNCWLDILTQVCARFDFVIYAYCMMGNHFHLLIETRKAHLAQGMRQLNGIYSQTFNRRHQLVGHVFQGRYTAILCQKESYLQELARYIVLNPVRAQLVKSVDEWNWSSHRYVMGAVPCPQWLNTTALLSHFGNDLQRAKDSYYKFVLQGLNAGRPMEQLRHQLHLGELAPQVKAELVEAALQSHDILRAQKGALHRRLSEYFTASQSTEAAIIQAHQSLSFSMSEIARHCGFSRRKVGRIIRAHLTKQ
ncbi:transposase [Pseudoduganella danionis]|uniref:transposase n=1 Tax=Pseudoduganella danionis TaxID=1890295 RepID=UPI0035B01527